MNDIPDALPAAPAAADPVTVFHRRIDALHDDIKAERAHSDARISAIEQALALNTRVTTEVRDLLNTWRIGMQVAGAIGKAAAWLRSVVLAVLALLGLYHAIHDGVPPGPPSK